jgi:hypothetical protein
MCFRGELGLDMATMFNMCYNKAAIGERKPYT